MAEQQWLGSGRLPSRTVTPVAGGLHRYHLPVA